MNQHLFQGVEFYATYTFFGATNRKEWKAYRDPDPTTPGPAFCFVATSEAEAVDIACRGIMAYLKHSTPVVTPEPDAQKNGADETEYVPGVIR